MRESFAQRGFMQVVGFFCVVFVCVFAFKQHCHDVSRHICGSERLRYFLPVYNVKTSFRGHQICCNLFPCLSWKNPLVIKRRCGMEVCLITLLSKFRTSL